MRRLLLMAVILLARVSLAAPLPLKVFILAGQSNMEGQAVVDLEGQDYNGGQGQKMPGMTYPSNAMKHTPASATRVFTRTSMGFTKGTTGL